MKSDNREFFKEFTMDMLRAMPEEKKNVLRNACRRSAYLTSYYGLSIQTVETYKEGWYIKFEGCRSGFSAWIGDNDGEFVFGKRKPKNISYLHNFNPNLSENDFAKI